jgi:RecG-like helicase
MSELFSKISLKLDQLRNTAAIKSTGVISVSIEELNKVNNEVKNKYKQLEQENKQLIKTIYRVKENLQNKHLGGLVSDEIDDLIKALEDKT